MENVTSTNWKWDDLLEIITNTENENIRTNILTDEVVIVEDYLTCRVGYKRNHKDLMSGFFKNADTGNQHQVKTSNYFHSVTEKRHKYA